MLSKASTCVAIVDDDDAVRAALRRLLQAAGISVEAFSGVGEFLASLGVTRPKCVVLDLHMPEITGLDLLSLISRAGANVPVIVITGDSSPDVEESVMRCGAAAVLRKPIEDKLLLDTIFAAITHSESR